MTERDYILATNLARARIILSILRDLLPSPGITENKLRDVTSQVGCWVVDIEKTMSPDA